MSDLFVVGVVMMAAFCAGVGAVVSAWWYARRAQARRIAECNRGVGGPVIGGAGMPWMPLRYPAPRILDLDGRRDTTLCAGQHVADAKGWRCARCRIPLDGPRGA